MADVVDYLAPQADIVTRMKTIPGLVRVYEPVDVAGLEAQSQQTPCAHVVYFGDRVDETAQGGASTTATLTWVVVVVDKLIAGAERRASVGPIMSQVITSLVGHKPAVGTPYVRVNAPSKPWFRNGYAYYPLAFTTNIKLRREL